MHVHATVENSLRAEGSRSAAPLRATTSFGATFRATASAEKEPGTSKADRGTRPIASSQDAKTNTAASEVPRQTDAVIPPQNPAPVVPVEQPTSPSSNEHATTGKSNVFAVDQEAPAARITTSPEACAEPLSSMGSSPAPSDDPTKPSGVLESQEGATAVSAGGNQTKDLPLDSTIQAQGDGDSKAPRTSQEDTSSSQTPESVSNAAVPCLQDASGVGLLLSSAATPMPAGVSSELPQGACQADTLGTQTGMQGLDQSAVSKTAPGLSNAGSDRASSSSSDLRVKRKGEASGDGQLSTVVSTASPENKVPDLSAASRQEGGHQQNGQDPAAGQQATAPVVSGDATVPLRDDRTSVPENSQPAAQIVAQNSPEVLPAVSSSQLIQSLQHSEMRVGLQSAEFGNISISTSLSHLSLSAQISTDHSELSRALAFHLPAMEEKLGAAYGVQARVEVRHGSGLSDGNDPSQQRRDHPSGGSGPRLSANTAMVQEVHPVSASASSGLSVTTSRLDIVV